MTLLMDALHHLKQNAASKPVVGHWCALRLQLDRATGEQVNIGVIFTPQGGAPSWRVLKSVGGLRCMYGAEGAANALFAIDQASSHLAQYGELPTDWCISASPALHASGESTSAVVAALFERVVPLARHELSDENRLDGDDHQLSTFKLRRRVRDIIRKRYGAKDTPDFWHDSPIHAATVDGHPVNLDLQVWTDSGTAIGVMAAITSVWYTSKFHRDSYLNNSYRALTEARQVAGGASANAGLFLLRPMNDSRFGESQLRDIDNEIDSMQWLLAKHRVTVRTFDNEASLAEGVLAVA